MHSYTNPTSLDTVRYTPGVGVDILSIIASSFTFAWGINDLGDVVFETPAAVYIDGQGSFDLDTLLTPASSDWEIMEVNWDIDINNSRQIIAVAYNSSTNQYGAVRLTPIGLGVEFVRGDVDADGAYGLPDAIGTLNHLFIAPWIACLNAADSNDDESIDLSDAVYTLAALFASGQLPPVPFPDCGTDPTAGSLDCLTLPCP